MLGEAGFAIRPRKGQFVVFDKPAAALARHILLPVPNEITKGVVVCRTVWGNLLVGPTAEEQTDRDRADLVPATLAALAAPAAQNLAAVAGLSTGAKPVCAGALSLLWLPGSLHFRSQGVAGDRAV